MSTANFSSPPTAPKPSKGGDTMTKPTKDEIIRAEIENRKAK